MDPGLVVCLTIGISIVAFAANYKLLAPLLLTPWMVLFILGRQHVDKGEAKAACLSFCNPYVWGFAFLPNILLVWGGFAFLTVGKPVAIIKGLLFLFGTVGAFIIKGIQLYKVLKAEGLHGQTGDEEDRLPLKIKPEKSFSGLLKSKTGIVVTNPNLDLSAATADPKKTADGDQPKHEEANPNETLEANPNEIGNPSMVLPVSGADHAKVACKECGDTGKYRGALFCPHCGSRAVPDPHQPS